MAEEKAAEVETEVNDADPASFAASVRFADPTDDAGESPAAEETELAVDDGLSAKAAEYGLDPDDFSSPEKMEKAIAAIDKQLAAFGKQPAETKAEATPEQATDDSPVVDEEEFNLDPDEYDDGLVKAFNGLKTKHAKEIDSLRQTVARLEMSERHRAMEMAEQELDSFFDSLGTEYRDVFGQGRMRSIDPKSKEAQSRLRLAEELDAIAAGDAKAGRKLDAFDKLAKRALRSAFGDVVEKVTQKKITSQVNQRKGQALSRPTQRGAKPVSGDQAAASFADKFYQEKGLATVYDAADDDRGI